MNEERLKSVKEVFILMQSDNTFSATIIEQYIASSEPWIKAGGSLIDGFPKFGKHSGYAAIADFFNMYHMIAKGLCCASREYAQHMYGKNRELVTARDVANKLQELIDEYNHRRQT